jgi:colicin import membrane protein
VAVHLLLAAFLVYGVHWQKHEPEAISVELVRALPDTVAVAPPPAPPEPEQKIEPEPKPVPHVAKPDIAVKAKEKPKPPPPKIVPPAPPRTPPQKVDPFAEQLRHETEQLQQRHAADAATAELDKLKADQAAASRNRAVADYLGKIRAKIRGNIVLPPDVKGNPETIFDVTQLPSGEVLSVKLKKSSGHAALDAAIERAVLKSSPLPKPDKGDIFNRSLELRFRPLDN